MEFLVLHVQDVVLLLGCVLVAGVVAAGSVTAAVALAPLAPAAGVATIAAAGVAPVPAGASGCCLICSCGRCGGDGGAAFAGDLRGFGRFPAFAGHVVDGHARFHVVHEHVELHGFAVVLNGLRFHLNPARYQVVCGEQRGDAVEHVVARAAHVVAHQLLVIQHAHRVERARARDEVLLVCVLPAQLVRDQVAAVVQHAVVDEAVFALHPPAWVYLRNVAALLVGYGVGSDACEGGAAAAFEIQIAELHKRSACLVLCRKPGHAVVDIDAQRAGVGGDVGDGRLGGSHVVGAGGAGAAVRAADGAAVAGGAIADADGAARCGKRERERQRQGG